MWTFNAEVDGQFGIIIITSANDHTEDEAAEAARVFLENDPGSLGGVAFAGELLDGDDVEESEIADDGSGGDTGTGGETSDGTDPVTFEEENFPEDLAAED